MKNTMKKIGLLFAMAVMMMAVTFSASAETKENIIECTHENVVIDEGFSPLCIDTGLTEGSHCADCGEILVAQEIIPATGKHSFTQVQTSVMCMGCGVGGSASDLEYSGTCGDNAEWHLKGGVLTITGYGKMTSVPWKNCYRNDWPDYVVRPTAIHTVNIAEGITNIFEGAFWGYRNIKSIIIPDSVTEIGADAFGNTGLEILPEMKNVKKIGGCAFSGCNFSLIEYPAGDIIMENDVFAFCEKLESVIVTSGVTSIAFTAFENCTNLKEVIIPDSVENINNGAFYNCTSLSDVYYDGTIKEWINIVINSGNDSLTSADLHDKNGNIVGKCGENAYWSFDECTGELVISGEEDTYSFMGIGSPFKNYESIKSVSFEKGITSIGAGFLYGCIFEMVYIADTVEKIDDYAFFGCNNMESIIIPDTIKSLGEGVFAYCKNLKKVILSENLTQVSFSLFEGCSNMENIQIPESVTNIDGCAFFGCKNLLNITIPHGVTNIGGSAFYGCSNLVEILIPETVIKIGAAAFAGCSSLLEITVPNKVTSIEYAVFGDCSSLSKITISDSVTEIEDFAFDRCLNIQNIYFIGTEKQWQKIKVINDGNENFLNATIHFTPCSHESVETYPGQDATCTESGYTSSTYCNDCETWIVPEEIIPASGHTAVIDEAVASTCTETGLTEGKHCSVCSEVIVAQEEVPSFGHSFTNYIPDGNATCTVDGTKTAKCDRCVETKTLTDKGSASGHKEIFTDYVDATCTEDGLSVGKVCENCGEVLIPVQVIPAKGHSLSGWIVASEATCELNGKRFKICFCGYTEEEVIYASGHIDADADGKCDNCEKILAEKSEVESEAKLFNFLYDILTRLFDLIANLFGIK